MKFNKYEKESTYIESENVVPPSDIVTYNELRSAYDLFRMKEEDVLDIQPDFQREFVWNNASQTRFIDSLIKQLPIPSMCFSYDYETEKWSVIDGLQRISTIIRFLDDDNWKLADLDDISPVIRGKKVKKIKEDDYLYKRVQNISLPITVVRYDTSKPEHYRYLFTIFHRLNTGGVKLTNQEIRNAIFNGPLNQLLIKLNDENKTWRKITKAKKNKSYRYKYEELILRFLAFQENLDGYNGNLTSFLNDFMRENKNSIDNGNRQKVFTRTMSIMNKLYDYDLDLKHSVTVIETLMYAIGKNIDTVAKYEIKDLVAGYNKVIKDKSLSKDSIKINLSSKDKFKERLYNAQNNILK